MILSKQLRRLKHATFSVRFMVLFLALGIIWFVLYATQNQAVPRLITKIRGRELLDNHIFFVETSGRKSISLRVACAIESVASLHPYRPVYVYSIAPLPSNHPNTERLMLLSNVRMRTLHLDTLFNNTPLQKWHESGILKVSLHPVQHLSDAVRLAILWKVGGTYLDTDMFAVRSLDGFQNALGCGLNDTAGNSALIFQKGHDFIYQCMEKFTSDYSTDSYDNQGPILVTRVLQAMCDGHPNQIQDVVNRPDQCKGVTLLPAYTFFAYGWQQWQHLFANKEFVDTSRSHTIHLYAKQTANVKGRFGVDTLLESLALQYCPNTFLRMVELNKL